MPVLNKLEKHIENYQESIIQTEIQIHEKNLKRLMLVNININSAYETLSNENKKYLYDRLGREKMDDPNIQQ